MVGRLVAWASAAWMMITASPRLAAAQGAPPSDGARGGSLNDSEDELVRRGTACFLRGDYACARAALSDAYEQKPQPATILKLGLSELHSDLPVEAAKHLREYLTHSEEPADKLSLVRTKWLPRAEGLTARLEVVAPAGADILLDGVVQGQSPVEPIVIRVGPHDVMARRGEQVDAQHVVASGGEVVRTELHLENVVDAPTPVPPPPSPPAPATSPAREPEQRERGLPRATWITVTVLGSAALIAAGVGVGFAAASWKQRGNADAVRQKLDPNGTGSECPVGGGGDAAACSQLARALQAQGRDATIADVAYVAAGVLGAASVATWLFWRPGHARARRLAVGPALSFCHAGFVLQGKW